MESLRHIFRLVAIARTLARHDALFPLDMLEAPPVVIALAKLLAGRPQAQPGLRPGERLAAALQALGPSFIKLGQALSVRADLFGAELADHLGRLRDRLPPFTAAEARATIVKGLGRPVEELFDHFDDTPLAAASIAQVHPATVPASDGEAGVEVAVKVLRPGVEAAFRRDLALFFWLARLATRAEPRMRRLKPVEVVQTLKETVDIEMDLRLEAAAAAELAENCRSDQAYRVPKVDWVRTSRRVLTIERVRGIPIDDLAGLRAAGHEPSDIAAMVIQVFLNQALRDGFFHADMHHGNLFVAEDGALVAVDFGIMGRLDRATRVFMAEMLLAFVTGDYRRAAEVHFDAGYVPAGKSVDAFAQACRSIGEQILGKPVSEISIGRLLAQLFQITETFDMETQPQLLLLQKTMVTAEGVARYLDPEINFWEVARPTIEAWMRDNLGPEARLAEAAGEASSLVRRLPGLLDTAERAARVLAEHGVRLDPETSALLRSESTRSGRAWQIAFAVAMTVLVMVLLLQI